MKVYEDISKKFFIYNNVIDESLFDKIFKDINNQIELGNQSIRFSVENKETKKIYNIDQKLYNKFTDYEKEMFHKKYDANYEILRKDCDININDRLEENIMESIYKIIKDIYGLNVIKIQHASIIQYLPGYLMRIHHDTNPDKPRLCTAVLYCNDMKENDLGGEVIFYDNSEEKNIVYTYTPKRNELIIFDSHFNEVGIRHSVNEIKNWNRYVYRIYFELPK